MEHTELTQNTSRVAVSSQVSSLKPQSSDDVLIKVEGVSKKFCRSLKRSLWYGVQDLGKEVLGRRHGGNGELRRDEFWANKDISFEVKRGETIGLIGHNGAGKTTLLRMLNGLIKPDMGRIEIRGRMQALIALGAGFNPILTGRENIYVNAAMLGIPKEEVDRKFDAIIDFSGIEEFIDAPVQSYSSGMVVRLGFSVAAHMEPEILLVDEVLAVGDEGFQIKCLNKIGELKNNGTAIVLVSHNMHTISTFSKSVILMHKGCSDVFNDAQEGISEYREKCGDGNDSSIKKIISGNDYIDFSDSFIKSYELDPGDSFSVLLKYRTSKLFKDAEIDLTMYSSNSSGQYFQATNKTYEEKIDFTQDNKEIEVIIHNIQVNNATVVFGLAIWTKDRTEQLLWWRIPVKFKGIKSSNGNNHLKVSYSEV